MAANRVAFRCACSVGSWFRSAPSERQPRRVRSQRLDLALLVGAQHDGVFRRIEIEPDDGLQFYSANVEIVTQLEGARQVPVSGHC